MKRSRRSYRQAALKGWVARRRHERERSQRAKRGWVTRRINAVELAPETKKRIKKEAAEKTKRILEQLKEERKAKLNREYFVVVLFRTRKRRKEVDRRLQEVIITARDGAPESEIKQKYSDWLFENTKWKAQDIYSLVHAPNAGRRVEVRVVPRDEPTGKPPGITANDARNPKKRKGKA